MTTEAFKDMSVRELASHLSTGKAVPGGGTASAVSGAMAAGLVGMVARLTRKRKKFESVWSQMESVMEEADALREDLLELAQDDSEAFSGVMKAWKLPGGEEKTRALERATMTAAEVPLKVTRRCLRVMQLSEETVARGNPMAVTDGLVALEMAGAGLKGAAYNVQINLGDLPPGDFRSETEEELAQNLEAADEILERCRRLGQDKLG